jgi:SNF2 family DNA or RNA helicase
VSYNMLRNIAKNFLDEAVVGNDGMSGSPLHRVLFECVVVDESHFISNPKSKLTQAVLSLKVYIPYYYYVCV